MELPLRILVLCTANSARSRITEALLAERGRDRIVARSAGTHPGPRVHPEAVRVLNEHGIPAGEGTPRGMDEVLGDPWDVVITVCDEAGESCPAFPGIVIRAHWGVPDPAGAADEPAAFREAFRVLSARVDRLLALPLATLDREALAGELVGIGREGGDGGGRG